MIRRNTSWHIFRQAARNLWEPVIDLTAIDPDADDEIHIRLTPRGYSMLVAEIADYWDASWAVARDGMSIHFPILRS
jgi:hypothetical protein